MNASKLFAVCVFVCVCGVSVCVSTDEAVKKEKTVKAEPNKSASADGQSVDGQKEVKVTPLRTVESRSVRAKRRVKGEGKRAHVLLSCFRNYYGFILSSCLPGVWLPLHFPNCIRSIC